MPLIWDTKNATHMCMYDCVSPFNILPFLLLKILQLHMRVCVKANPDQPIHDNARRLTAKKDTPISM